MLSICFVQYIPLIVLICILENDVLVKFNNCESTVYLKKNKTKKITGAVALANIFAGRQPYFLPKMASKSVMVPMPFYKRSSFIDIPFGMPYFKLFYF